jgi:uncharacterized zinc-type alcohol dehydrogenase-like protein
MLDAIGYAADGSWSTLKPRKFQCDDPGARDVQIEIMYCGVCHSDIHQVKNEWNNTVYPCMPGHEIVGRAVRVGGEVHKVSVGDIVGVGCMIDSCRECEACRAGEENYCEGPNSWLATYNGPMKPAKKSPTGENMYGRDNTFGGYATTIVVPEHFVLKIPASLNPAAAAPILCAGVTTYSPMKHWKVKEGDRVGIVGFGGLGDMAAKIAKALGADVTIFSTSKDKLEAAAQVGADAIVLESDTTALAKFKASFSFILDTVPTEHDVNPYVELLQHDGALVVVGALQKLKPVDNMEVAAMRRSVAGSLIGSIAETQDVLNFCAEHRVAPDIQMIRIQDINEAMNRVEKGEVRFRYVIDAASFRDEV